MIQDVRMYRGANVDYNLVIAEKNMGKFTREREGRIRKRLNISDLEIDEKRVD